MVMVSHGIEELGDGRDGLCHAGCKDVGLVGLNGLFWPLNL